MLRIKTIKTLFSQVGLLFGAAIPILVICYLSYQIADSILAEEIKQTLSIFTQKKVQAIDNFIHERKLDTQQFANLPSVKSLLSNDAIKLSGHVKEVFKSFLNEASFDEAYLFSKDGKTVYSSDLSLKSGSLLAKLNKDQIYFNNLFELSTTLLSPAVSYGEHYKKGLRKIFFSSPVFDQGVLKGVLIISLHSGALSTELLQSISLSESTTYIAANIDQKTEVLFSSEQFNQGQSSKARKEILTTLGNAASGESGFSILDKANFPMSLLVYRYVPELNMGLLMEYQADKVYEKNNWLKKRIIFLSYVSALVIIMLAYWIIVRLKKSEEKSKLLRQQVLPKKVSDLVDSNKTYSPEVLIDKPFIIASIENLSQLSDGENVEDMARQLSQLHDEFELLFSMYGVDKLSHFAGRYHLLIDNDDNVFTQSINLSLALQNTMSIYNRQYDTQFSLKVVISSARLMAALLDDEKASFDVWGQAYDQAKQLLLLCPLSGVLVTEKIYQGITSKEVYLIEERETIETEGGELKTYEFYIRETS